jgi:hypothetical protein
MLRIEALSPPHAGQSLSRLELQVHRRQLGWRAEVAGVEMALLDAFSSQLRPRELF